MPSLHFLPTARDTIVPALAAAVVELATTAQDPAAVLAALPDDARIAVLDAFFAARHAPALPVKSATFAA